MTKRYTTGMAQIEPRFLLWRKIRIPLAVGVVAILLIISGLLLRSFLIARGIRNDLAHATELAAADTVQSHSEALSLLEQLHEDYPIHEAILVRHAWQLVLVALRYGPSEERLSAADAALARTTSIEPTPLLLAARAGMALARGNVDESLQIIGEHPDCREGLFVRALAESRRGQIDQAIALLDQARQGTPTFIPALSELSLLLRQSGRYEEAEAALQVLTRTSPEHEDAAIQSVLLSLDRNAGTPALDKLIPSLSKSLSNLNVDADHPRSLAYKSFAEGRLDLLQGKVAAAEKALGNASKVLKTDQSVATWLARARHRGGHHEEALAALSSFPDAAGTDAALIRTRLEILLDLHRTVDAEGSLAALSKAGQHDIAALQGRLLFDQGELAKSVAPLRAALKAGSRDAGLSLAEALVYLGRAEQARGVLRSIKGQDAEALCAQGYLAFLDAKTQQATAELLKASKAGGRCGASLAGRLLVSAGGWEGQMEPLVKALREREDLRDRVTLSRLKFRVEGNAAARSELDAVKALQPQGALVLRELAAAYEEIGATPVAREVAAAAVKASKGSPIVVAIAARLDREGRKLADADRLLSQGLKTHPKSLELNLERARLDYDRNRFADAEEAADRAFEPGAVYADAACLRADIQLRRGERETAQVDLNRAIVPARRHSGAAVEVAIRECLVEFHLRRGPSALGRAKTAFFFLRQVPFQDAEVEYLAGQIAERENRPTEAAERYRSALKLDPANLSSWQRLEKLQSLTAEEQQLYQRIRPSKSPGD